MKLLILGGTEFLGKHIVEAALAHVHEVTLFHRGKTNPDLFPEVERVLGDREHDLHRLEGYGPWDAVIDTSGYVPRVVRASSEALKDRVQQYVFISTISVYSDSKTWDQDEDAPVATLENEAIEEVTGQTYGALKVLCERAVEAVIGEDRTLILRPGLIVGPDDPTDRFTYWPMRISRGGEVLCPGEPEARTQFIDVRDLAAWTLRLIDQRQSGLYNATGPQGGTEMQAIMEASKTASSSDAEFIWADEAWLLDQGVKPWSELPLWIPEADSGVIHLNVDRAVNAGLTFRPIEVTARDTLAWAMAQPQQEKLLAGMDPEREKALLEQWKSRSSQAMR